MKLIFDYKFRFYTIKNEWNLPSLSLALFFFNHIEFWTMCFIRANLDTISEILFYTFGFQNGSWRCRVPRRYCLARLELQWHHIYQQWHTRISGLENDLSTREQNPQICRYPETAAVAKSLQLDFAWEPHWELSQLQVYKFVFFNIYLAHVIEQPNLRIPNPQYLQLNFCFDFF